MAGRVNGLPSINNQYDSIYAAKFRLQGLARRVQYCPLYYNDNNIQPFSMACMARLSRISTGQTKPIKMKEIRFVATYNTVKDTLMFRKENKQHHIDFWLPIGACAHNKLLELFASDALVKRGLNPNRLYLDSIKIGEQMGQDKPKSLQQAITDCGWAISSMLVRDEAGLYVLLPQHLIEVAPTSNAIPYLNDWT